ncbi:CDP-diacylglycerol--serine O-phosphatidyltransferase [Clostridium tagluense]|uniref:CDP-diacylglycerol--serine O-phosphatidyltransferase n=1 Tax=Clostridium tagluense TaxID=360422 RepID=UPI001CF0F40E|nr:CDP-diacylglycerol--serine O-phosphatidyltransferase [Clostridium tagluense]MCB2313697.1 CDP-diacylglycerol--serine O-phosphatidyltransferase [Clostridium tagluense]MCB2318547.1 CDP-diacylglycerol--serine O-phosphatidyltransferase [Clostridium tagluense]MCB2323359.1 CDP-diacylglycerol--serine O-phosphatidyltransferase [Clostridium tagluense]MCB2328348.1 CDP-diacylglycerol--serine O-phosphatidyltransferase [Clostridium tagluense]MCB2333190.1 CDP-diacylglycerol--serine O-phosphatidyltransfera
MFKKYIPNILTFLNLSFGILSIVEVINNNYFAAALFIIGAALIDRYDGKIARILNVSSEIGKELDSLANLVSFGVVPGLLIFFKFGLNNYLIGTCIMLFYIICGCYRLAKYNISIFEGVFSGVPITITGSALAILSLIITSTKIVPGILMILFGYFMISKLKLKKI